MPRKFLSSGLAASMLALGAAGCATTGATASAETESAAATRRELPKSISPGFVAVRDDCVISPAHSSGSSEAVGGTVGAVLLALGEAVIPAVSGFFFDRLVDRAEAATYARTSSTTGESDGGRLDRFWTYDPSENSLTRRFGCVIFVRPAHANSTIAPNIEPALAGARSDWRDALNTAIPGLALGEGETPELIAEFRVEPVRVLRAQTDLPEFQEIGFRLRAATLAYAATGAQRTSAANAKDLAFNVELSGLMPNDQDSVSEQSVYSGAFLFEDAPIGSFAALGAGNTPQGLLSGKVGAVSPLPAARFSTDAGDFVTQVPLRAEVTVTELESGGDLSRAMLHAIRDSKAEVTQPLEARLRRALHDEIEAPKREAD